MWGVFVFVSVLGGALCRPSIPTSFGNFSTEPLSEEDMEWLARHTPMHRGAYPPGFQFMYVARDGRIVLDQRPSSGNYIEVVGSPRTPRNALYVACITLGKMLRNTPTSIFNKIARKPGTGLGLFTAQETLGVFPESAALRDPPQCKGRCDGSCSNTCTFDGRKFTSLSGITLARALVLVDIVMCTAKDPYGHKDNIEVHEFAHVLERDGLSVSQKRQVKRAYQNAKAKSLWTLSSYAMGNQHEYFAEGTGAYFLVNLHWSSGGMTDCPGGHQCRTEQEARSHLHDRDIQLWTLLTSFYTGGDATISSHLKICQTFAG